MARSRVAGVLFASGLALVACGRGTLSTGMGPSGRAGITGGGRGGAGGSVILTGTGGGPNCGNKALPAKTARLDVLVLLDASASMDEDLTNVSCDGGCGAVSKWAEATAAINTVVGRTETTVNWGLKLFPDPVVSSVCAVANTVSVPVGPRNATAVAGAIADRTSANGGVRSAGNTATRAAEMAAADYLSMLADGNRRMILLVTDGAPNCGPGSEPSAGDGEGAVAAIRQAWLQGIPTFVVGIVTSGDADDEVLNEMAIVGGEPRQNRPAYHPVAESAGLVDVLTAMVQDRAPCVYALPQPPNDGYSNSADIAVTLDGVRLPYDSSRANGWTYTDNAQTHVQLFGAACEAATPAAAHELTVEFLCILQ